jgi:hypothetical protein
MSLRRMMISSRKLNVTALIDSHGIIKPIASVGKHHKKGTQYRPL